MHTDYFLQRDYLHEESCCTEACLEPNRKMVPAFGKMCLMGCLGLSRKTCPALEEIGWLECSGQNRKTVPASEERRLCLWTRF